MIYDGQTTVDGASHETFMIGPNDYGMFRNAVLTTDDTPPMVMWVKDVYGVTRADRNFMGGNEAMMFVAVGLQYGVDGSQQRELEPGEKVTMVGMAVPRLADFPAASRASTIPSEPED